MAENEGVKIGGEAEEGSSLSPSEQESRDEAIKTAARGKGWRPKKEWSGPTEDWVPAREFLGRQKLFDKIHDLKNQLSRQAQKFEGDMSQISGHFAKVREVEYQRAKRDLEGQLKAAKAAEDVDAVAEIASQIKEVEVQEKQAKDDAKVAAQQKQSNGGATPEFLDWQRSNESWWQKDTEMTQDAISIGTGYAAANPARSQKDVLDHVTTKIKKMYPEKFGGRGGNGKEEDNRVEGGGGTNRGSGGGKKGKLSASDLTDDERMIMNAIVKRGALKEIAEKNKRSQAEEYLAQLADRQAVK